MALYIFNDERFQEFAKNPEHFHGLRDTYIVFQWIFRYRFFENELIHPYHAPDMLEKINTDIMLNNITSYRWANLKIILLYIKKYSHLSDHFEIYNSYEKITWQTFTLVIQKIIPDFNELEFGMFLINSIGVYDCPLSLRLISDFQDLHEGTDSIIHQMQSPHLRKRIE